MDLDGSFPLVLILLPVAQGLWQMEVLEKCCLLGDVLNDALDCVPANLSRNFSNATRSREIEDPPRKGAFECPKDTKPMVTDHMEVQSYFIDHPAGNYCIGTIGNGAKVLVTCGLPSGDGSPSAFYDLDMVVFWGAQTYMSTNIAHVVFCIVVVVIYVSIPQLGRTLHDRAILRHNVALLMLGSILTLLGYFDLCGCPPTDTITTLLWLLLQFFTLATVFWLNVICFDMTLAITSFRRVPATSERDDRAENRKLLIYDAFAWGGALLPTTIAAVFEYWPNVPKDFPLKPNYIDYRKGPNVMVNLYFFGIPMLTLLCNNVLFVFTTCKIVWIQRTTEIATQNQTSALRTNYFLFLRLYLLMGAPWFFGSLLACLNKLIVLKICRLIQPILWLLMLATDRRLRHDIAKKCKSLMVADHQKSAPIGR
ncbi:probable G-protein coupled receptor Mth-like 1 [Orussus abietinus]|uniref:probable G-protein coupled receptor Mth-like 1 n=1 Tax=Orussus abietinus TaxID=222816 RepID=UPI0006263283|nr:probable G-protein coupled receptor Mth-like 1 [Orussus abietinus]